jgi:hypothetical protein
MTTVGDGARTGLRWFWSTAVRITIGTLKAVRSLCLSIPRKVASVCYDALA